MPNRFLISSAESVLSQVAADRIRAQLDRPGRLNVPRPEKKLNGEPLCQANTDATCQPPTTWFRKPPLIDPPSTLAKRQLVNRVRGDHMGHVELRAAGVELAARVVHERLEPVLRRSARIGVGVGQRVIHLPEEAAAEPAPNLDLQRVVIGERAVHDGLRRVDPAVRHERRASAPGVRSCM